MSAELNETEREALARELGGHHATTSKPCPVCALIPTVERILAERETALRESIAAEIEVQRPPTGVAYTLPGRRKAFISGVLIARQVAARIARGATS